MTEKKKRLTYVSPHIEVIHMENEEVIATSGGVNGYGNGGAWGKASPAPKNTYGNPASASDIEEMLNDFFTVEQ